MSDPGPVDPPAPQDGDEAGQQDPQTPRSYDEEYVKRLRAESAKYRTEARAQTAELEKFRQASMSDQEKAIAQAKAEARSEVLGTLGRRLVDAEVKAAAAGRTVDVEALLDGLDRSRFLTGDGEPDVKAIEAWVNRIAPPKAAPGFPDLGQGSRPPANTGGDMNALLRRAAGRQ